MRRAHGIMPQTIEGVVRRVKAVFLSCLDVMLLRVGPQVFPRSRILLGFMLLAYFLTDVLDAWLYGYSAVPVLLQSVLDAGIWVFFYLLLLGAWSVLPRLEQTLTAWFGAGVLFNLLSIPVILGDVLLPGADAQAWLFLPKFALILWPMMVMAYLLHHALRTGYALAVVLAVVCGLMNIGLLYYLFPVA